MGQCVDVGGQMQEQFRHTKSLERKFCWTECGEKQGREIFVQIVISIYRRGSGLLSNSWGYQWNSVVSVIDCTFQEKCC